MPLETRHLPLPHEALVLYEGDAGAESYPPAGPRGLRKSSTIAGDAALAQLREAIDRAGGVVVRGCRDYPVIVVRLHVDALDALSRAGGPASRYSVVLEARVASLAAVRHALRSIVGVVDVLRLPDGRVRVVLTPEAFADYEADPNTIWARAALAVSRGDAPLGLADVVSTADPTWARPGLADVVTTPA